MRLDVSAICRLGRRLALASTVMLTSAIPAASAETNRPASIVLVADHEGKRVNNLLQAELAQLGLNVIVVDRGERDLPPSELTKTARQHGAFAAFRVLVAQGRVEVWLADRATGKVLLREVLETQLQPSETTERTVVARAVELLRASLLELDLDGRPASDLSTSETLPKTITPVAPLRAQPASSAQPRLAVHATVELMAAGFDTGPSAGLGLALGWGLGHRLTLKGRISVPLVGPELSAPEGRVQLTPYFAAMSVGWNSRAWLGHWHIGVESGIGLLWTRVVGVGANEFSGKTANESNPMPVLGAAISYAATPHLALELGLLGGVGLHPSRLVLAEGASVERAIGHYGRWLGIAGAGLCIGWN